MSGARLIGPSWAMLFWGVAVALVASVLPLAPATTMAAPQSIGMPFPGGKAVRIIQGYNGGTHRGSSQYGLDLVLADGGTSGTQVVSPIEGSVAWARGPGVGNGCLAIAFRDGSYSLMLCHVVLSRAYRAGESIARGQSLGTVGPPGTVGNNGAPHVHLELHRGGRASSPVPFSAPDGLPLEGVSLAASGGYSEHSRREPILSTTGGGGGAVLSASTLPGLVGTPVEIGSVASAAPAAEAPRATGPTRAAVVRGTESCLNVRKEPSTRASLLGCLPEGTAVAIAEGPKSGDGFAWYRIERAQSLEAGGWVVGEYLGN